MNPRGTCEGWIAPLAARFQAKKTVPQSSATPPAAPRNFLFFQNLVFGLFVFSPEALRKETGRGCRSNSCS